MELKKDDIQAFFGHNDKIMFRNNRVRVSVCAMSTQL